MVEGALNKGRRQGSGKVEGVTTHKQKSVLTKPTSTNKEGGRVELNL